MDASILIADDHPLFREALRLVTQEVFGTHSIISECASLDEALPIIKENHHLELALIDINMPGMDGLSGLTRLHDVSPTLPIIVVSADERRSTIDSAFRAGASGFIPKSLCRSDMAQAIQCVLEGNIFIPPTLSHPISLPKQETESDLSEITNRIMSLTKQERCILDYITRGQSNKVVAIELNIAESTVKAHVSSILRKLGVHSRTQIVIKVGPILNI